MKKGTGAFIANLAAAAGSAAAIFALKKKNQAEQYDYDEFDDDLFDDCECCCVDEECECCGDEFTDSTESDDSFAEDTIPDEEIALDSIEEDIEDPDITSGSDF
ncbi:MAG: hypothetical protein WC900_08655 [Oscillospiraceae bacterium]|jgi:hypothetical protein